MSAPLRRKRRPASPGRESLPGAPVLIALPVVGVVALAILTLAHDLTPVHPPRVVSWLIAFGAVIGLSTLVAREVATRIRATVGLRRAAAVLVGAAAGALPVLRPLLALLGGDVPPAAQLAWMLGEEDNAQIVGVAREIVVDGPRGGVLARQYGTGFMALATTLMRMTGSPDPGLDPRLLGIHAFTLSTALAALTLVAAVAVLILLSLDGHRAARLPGLTALSAATAGATMVALAVALVLPMRTGFLTFVWGMAWIALGACVIPLLDRPVGPTLLAVITAHVIATTALAIRSWPFLIAAALPAATLVASYLRAADVRRLLRRRPRLVLVALVGPVVGLGIYLWNGALGEVVSYGVRALTIAASGITFDDRLRDAVLLAVAASGFVLLRERGWRVAVGIAGPAAAGWVSWLVLNGAAQVLTGGEFNYGGAKLLYGVVGMATLTALPVLLTMWSGRSPSGATPPRAVAAVAVLLLWGSPTVAELPEWSSRLAPSDPPHAVAMILAIERTDPDLPVRCRPEPGTVATPDSRWAAYFCVRWVEDALNARDRSGGYRFDYLKAPDGTFDPIVAEATAEGHYGFAYVMPLGPGWFGWDGRS